MMAVEERIIVPYGAGAAGPGAPALCIERSRREPLRLNNAPYDFAEPPDLTRLVGHEARLGFLRDHLIAHCGLWDGLPRLFLELYFAWIDMTLERHRDALAAAVARLGGVFDHRDWSWSALRPLPQALLPAGGKPVRVDIGFWTGDAFVALDLAGSASRSRARGEEFAALRASGVAVIEIAGAALRGEGAPYLDSALPRELHQFWRGETLPLSPFGPDRLEEIVLEPE